MEVETERAQGCGCNADDSHDGRHFCVNTEGTEHSWPRPTITTEEIAKLGGWDPNQGVIEVHEDNTEHTLEPREVVHLRPGRAFCRRVRWKRGLTRADRIAADVDLLRRVFPNLEFKECWIRIPGIALPSGWNRPETDAAFVISDAFPAAPPTGLFVPCGLRFNGNMPQCYSEPAGTQLPFPGSWGSFSWTIAEADDWRPGVSVEKGVNLLQWVRGFNQRFAEGA